MIDSSRVEWEGAPWAPGSILSGRFVIEGLLVRSPMSDVYTARAGNRPVILKRARVIDDAGHDPRLVARGAREAEILRDLKHPQLPSLVALMHEDDGTPIVALERLPGESLYAWMRSQREGARVLGRRIDPTTAMQVALKLLDVLAFVHARSVVHRDVKPKNVMIVERPREAPSVWLLDFGVAARRAGDGRKLTRQGESLGTPAYMAPEQLGDAMHADPRADVYSVGAILFEMLVGRRAVDAREPSSDGADEVMRRVSGGRIYRSPQREGVQVSDALEAVVVRALAYNPRERFQDAGEMAAALRALMAAPDHDDTIRAQGPRDRTTLSPTSRTLPPASRAWRWLAAGAALSALVATAAAVHHARRAPPPTDTPRAVAAPVTHIESREPPAQTAAPVTVDAGAPVTAPRRPSSVARETLVGACTRPACGHIDPGTGLIIPCFDRPRSVRLTFSHLPPSALVRVDGEACLPECALHPDRESTVTMSARGVTDRRWRVRCPASDVTLDVAR